MLVDPKYLSRKFVLSVGIQVTTTIGLLAGLVDSDGFVTVSTVNIGAYSLANTVSAVKKGN